MILNTWLKQSSFGNDIYIKAFYNSYICQNKILYAFTASFIQKSFKYSSSSTND
jgi:hypothetical protein